jgi:hypothetical protein
MNKNKFLAVWACASLPMIANAQGTEQESPTKESVSRLLDASNGYVRMIVDALRWKAPATQVCAQMREFIERLAQPMLDQPQSAGPLTPELLLEKYQQIEENTMARHALFSHRIYDAIVSGCLIVPDPNVQKEQ